MKPIGFGPITYGYGVWDKYGNIVDSGHYARADQRHPCPACYSPTDFCDCDPEVVSRAWIEITFIGDFRRKLNDEQASRLAALIEEVV